MAGAGVRIERFRGQTAVVLSSGRVEATFLPDAGMLGSSLTFDGDENLSLHGGLPAWRAGHTTGLPLLYPWANRLSGDAYRAAGTDVSLAGDPAVHRDGNGLPMHGTLLGEHRWEVVRLEARRKRATLVTRFDLGAHPELAASFPFPHVLEVAAEVQGRRLAVTTTVRPTGRSRVPVSFGWHPYFRLPGVRRADITLELPARNRLELDDRQLPTGATVREAAEADVLGRRTFDSCYRLAGRSPWTMAMAGGGRRVEVTLDAGYRYAQVYAPAGKPFVALEPMTAPVDALVAGETRRAKPGSSFSATFEVRFR